MTSRFPLRSVSGRLRFTVFVITILLFSQTAFTQQIDLRQIDGRISQLSGNKAYALQVAELYLLKAKLLNAREMSKEAFYAAKEGQKYARQAAETHPWLESECLIAMAREVNLIKGPESALPFLENAEELLTIRNQTGTHTMAMVYLSMAEFQEAANNYAEAEKIYQKARVLAETSLPSFQPRKSGVFQALSTYYYRRGDYVTSFEMMKKAAELYQQVPESNRDVQQTANLYQDYGKLLNKLGYHQEAVKEHEKAFQKLSELHGPGHPASLVSLIAIGGIMAEVGQWQDAYELTGWAEEGIRKSRGEKYRIRCVLENNLGFIALQMGRTEEAEQRLKLAYDLGVEMVGESHPMVANVLATQAACKFEQGNPVEAVRLQKRAHYRYTAILESLLATGDEQQKLDFLQKISGKTHYAYWLGIEAASDNSEGADLASLTALQRKGLVADVMSQVGEGSGKEPGTAGARLAEIRQSLADAYFSPGKISPSRRQTLEQEAESLVRQLQLSGSVDALSLSYSLKDLMKVLPDDAVYLEYVEYRPFKKGVPKAEEHTIGKKIAVRALTRKTKSPWVILGSSEEVESRVRQVYVGVHDVETPRADQQLKEAYTLLIAPMEEWISPKSKLIVSPDAALNLLPFAALKNLEGVPLCNRVDLWYVNSARDLILNSRAETTKARGVVLVGGIDYNTPIPASDTKHRPSRSRDFRPFHIEALPGTVKELETLKQFMPEATVLDGSRASEDQISHLNPPRILHLATHGFFMEDQPFEIIRVPLNFYQEMIYVIPKPPENPMIRSGIILAGANQLQSGNNDGFLTALEVSSMNLKGTELVVLSSCSTGMGDVLPGEGVFGLRRGFQLAGADSVLLTLWSISDEVAIEFMSVFYRSLLDGQSKAAALRTAQQEMQKGQFSHPFYWGAFTLVGDGGPLSWNRKAGGLEGL